MVWFLLIASMALMAGCAGKTGPVEQVFFPPPPNLPRIQYLMGIADSTDVEGKNSDFSLFGSLNEQGDKVRAIVKPYGVAEFGGKIYICDVGSAKVIVLDLPAKKFEYLKGAVGNGKLTPRSMWPSTKRALSMWRMRGARRCSPLPLPAIFSRRSAVNWT